MSEAIGIMEGAFFVSRNDLIQWINSTFHLNISRIEQLGSGSVYCQIFDAIHPGKISMSKVNWRAKLEWEFINNFKILQQAFLKCNLKKVIETERLAKAKYQDNLEFAQWMKRYYDINHGGGRDYDPDARRNNVSPDFGFAEKQHPQHHQQHPHLQHQPISHVRTNVKAGNEGKSRQPTSYGRSKELRSMSPSTGNDARKRSNLAKKRADPSDDSRHNEHEIKTLYQNYVSIKNVIQSNRLDNEAKLQMIAELADQGMKNKVFENERRVEKRNLKSNIGKIDEEREVSTYC